jgi:DNA-binding XRE family transcriptional regulator
MWTGVREVLPMEINNNLRQVRETKMLSKSELAKRAGISPLTIDRIEKGMPSRIATRRKILLGLGLKLSERHRVFGEN